MAEDDPFAVFGEDDDDGDETDVPSWAGQKLVEQANERMTQKRQEPQKHGEKAPSASKSVQLSSMESLQLWPNSPPLYLGPIRLVTSLPVGGGRGFVATRDLAPGTLVLVEEPVVKWSDEQIGIALDLISVQQLLDHPDIIQDMEDFHPTKRAVDEGSGDNVQVKDMMAMLAAQYEQDDRLIAFVELSKERGLTSRDSSSLTARDMLRLLLALRYNGLESGVYRHVAMMNHDCHPNCVKFMPKSGYSEVRTTRHVLMGESLTISYLPRIVSHATRRKLLWDQHRFDIGTCDAEWHRMEFIGTLMPPSSRKNLNEASVTFGIESATSQLEDHYREAQVAVQLDATAANPVWQETKALEVASLELYTESVNRLRNDHHILLIPCLRLHLDACELVQRDPSLTKRQRIGLLCRLVCSARLLLELQKCLYGKDHFDLAQTNLEFAQAMEELLSTAPKQVVGLGMTGMSTFETCSSAEYKARKEHERIRLLYPHDAETLIKEQQTERSKRC